MTTVLFVHGTGVRSPDFEPAFAQIAHKLQSRRSDLQVGRRQIEQAEPPVVLLAHNLGEIACVDLLVQQEYMRQQVQLVVTVGSQVPFFYAIGALQRLPSDQKVPTDFPFWLNIYDLNGFLSYIGAKVFPNQVQDERVDNRLPFPQAHGAYWTNPAAWEAIISRQP